MRGDLGGEGGGCGQENQEAGAGGNVVFDAQSAVMLGDYSAGDGEAEAGAAFFGGKVRQEQAVFVLGRNAVAGVGDFDFDGLGVVDGTRRDGDAAKLRAFKGFSGIVHQIDDDAANEFGVSLDGGKGSGKFAPERDAVEASVKNGKGFGGDGIDVDGREARGREARELRKFVDECFERAHFALNEISAFGDELRKRACAIVAAARGRGALQVTQQTLRGKLN